MRLATAEKSCWFIADFHGVFNVVLRLSGGELRGQHLQNRNNSEPILGAPWGLSPHGGATSKFNLNSLLTRRMMHRLQRPLHSNPIRTEVPRNWSSDVYRTDDDSPPRQTAATTAEGWMNGAAAPNWSGGVDVDLAVQMLAKQKAPGTARLFTKACRMSRDPFIGGLLMEIVCL
ncbi:unnamed protein product [Vitrella brassicaformis CCMP3155]|uniref:Uncharacterized protein n=1 Tax=Vitrella brassicaformis (strain CCMP3155) TaxID=1169540 RepID=A0A0G4EB00_VITBC|nr:unnamed protein product [Vitrella brassicaformis CCMP3155]|eukprot:CEL93099.1 unnamed protein product [Vitrella brassicaformis CCMP3155]